MSGIKEMKKTTSPPWGVPDQVANLTIVKSEVRITNF